MPRISEETVERVASANDVVDVVGSYLALKRAGSSWRALCPFHNEKTPSLHVNPARQTFHCFGCGAGGSVFRFVMDYEHVDFPTAVRRLAARANIPILEESGEDAGRRSERDRLLALHRDAAAWFHANLMKRRIGEPARKYLRERGVSAEVAARWGLGFAPDAWTALVEWAAEAGYATDELIRSGLAASKEGRDSVYDRFRNRVIFPIRSDYGEVIAFSGRTLAGDPAKYVNSPETPIFVKGKTLYGLDLSKRAIIDANEAVVCEGQLDLIAAFEAGVQNVIAPQGTAFTANQARILRRFAESAVLCFDPDTAGSTAVDRSLPSLLAAGVSVRVARLPDGHDPDSLVRAQGADALKAVVRAAPDYFDDALVRGLKGDPSPRERAALSAKLASMIRAIEEPALSEAVALRVCTRLGLAPAAFAAIVAKARRPDNTNPAAEASGPAEALELSEGARLLCALALAAPEVREWLKNQPAKPTDLGPDFALLEKILASASDLADPASLAAFTAGLTGAEERAIRGLQTDRLPEDRLALAAEAWRGLVAKKTRERIAEIQARMRTPSVGPEDAVRLHKTILDLQSDLAHLAKPFFTKA